MMPFGKFKGMLIADLPDDYLQWLLGLGADLREPLRSAVCAEWRARQEHQEHRRGRQQSTGAVKALPDGVVELSAQIIQVGYRRLAQEHHPDHGGDGQTMMRLNLAMEALRAWLTTQRLSA